MEVEITFEAETQGMDEDHSEAHGIEDGKHSNSDG